MPVPAITMSDFRYELPSERIALFPLAERDTSRLLVCDAVRGAIEHRQFRDLPDLLPPDSLVLINDTRVVRARILMRKETGARVELLLLEPLEPAIDPAVAMGARGRATWRCMVGGARRARGGKPLLLEIGNGDLLTASVASRDEDAFRVELAWPGHLTFAEVLESAGRVPLPPYIHRDPVEGDVETYQTVYAEQQGSVAAPTAGLHFTERTLNALRSRGVEIQRVTLHVGAGTFRPVQTDRAAEHTMHHERIAVPLVVLDSLIAHARRRERSPAAPLVVVGTTSLRTLESLYWFGVKIIDAGSWSGDELEVEQWDPYRLPSESTPLPTLEQSFATVRRWATERSLETITGWTQIMIVPGYHFAACDGLITNFHLPESTLILLVAALLGRDLWRRVYEEALGAGYRFLSYGDSSLLLREPGRFRSPSAEIGVRPPDSSR